MVVDGNTMVIQFSASVIHGILVQDAKLQYNGMRILGINLIKYPSILFLLFKMRIL
jgi:hypothetical protein